MDCSPPGSSVHGISQARILKKVIISSSKGVSWPRDRTHVSCIGRWILDCCTTWEAPSTCFFLLNVLSLEIVVEALGLKRLLRKTMCCEDGRDEGRRECGWDPAGQQHLRALEEEETQKGCHRKCEIPKDGPMWGDCRMDKKWSAERCSLGLAIQRPSVGLPWWASG